MHILFPFPRAAPTNSQPPRGGSGQMVVQSRPNNGQMTGGYGCAGVSGRIGVELWSNDRCHLAVSGELCNGWGISGQIVVK